MLSTKAIMFAIGVCYLSASGIVSSSLFRIKHESVNSLSKSVYTNISKVGSPVTKSVFKSFIRSAAVRIPFNLIKSGIEFPPQLDDKEDCIEWLCEGVEMGMSEAKCIAVRDGTRTLFREIRQKDDIMNEIAACTACDCLSTYKQGPMAMSRQVVASIGTMLFNREMKKLTQTLTKTVVPVIRTNLLMNSIYPLHDESAYAYNNDHHESIQRVIENRQCLNNDETEVVDSSSSEIIAMTCVNDSNHNSSNSTVNSSSKRFNEYRQCY